MKIEDITKALEYADDLSKQGFILWLEIEAQWRERSMYRGEIIYEYSKEKGIIIQEDPAKLDIQKYESLVFSMMMPVQKLRAKHVLVFRIGKVMPLDFFVRAIHFTSNVEWCVSALYVGEELTYFDLETAVKKNIGWVLLNSAATAAAMWKELKQWKKYVLLKGNSRRLEIEVYRTKPSLRIGWEILKGVEEYYDKIKQPLK